MNNYHCFIGAKKQGNYNASTDTTAETHAIPALPVKPIGLLNRGDDVWVYVVYAPITCFPTGEVVYNVIRIFVPKLMILINISAV